MKPLGMRRLLTQARSLRAISGHPFPRPCVSGGNKDVS